MSQLPLGSTATHGLDPFLVALDHGLADRSSAPSISGQSSGRASDRNVSKRSKCDIGRAAFDLHAGGRCRRMLELAGELGPKSGGVAADLDRPLGDLRSELVDAVDLAQGHECLVDLLLRDVRTDGTVREDVRAKLRSSIKRLLVKYKYPPDKQPGAIKLVMEQLEQLAPRYAHAM